MRDSQEGADLVTGKDLEIALAPLRYQLKLYNWMLGAILAGVLALVLKTFFG